MVLLHALFYFMIVTSNFITAYDQNNHVYFQTNISCNPAHNSSKPAIRLSYGGYKYISEPFRPPVGSGAANKKSSKKEPVQKSTGQLNSAQKTAIQSAVTKRISEVAKSYHANFDAMYPTMYQSLQQFALNPRIKQSDVEHAFTYQMMHHLITTNQTDYGIITRYQQHPWVENKDISKASQEEKVMVNYMLDCMVRAENNTTIELAQAALQKWIQAQSAQSLEEYESYIKKCNNYYSSMQHKTPTQSILQQAKPVQKTDIENLSQNYTAIIKTNSNNKSLDTNSLDAQYIARIEKRVEALVESKEQLRTNKLVHHTYEMSLEARGFLMANNMNYAAFDGENVTNFQHCLTQEILGIIESSVNTVQRNGCQSIITQLAYYNCNLAISAQQLNQLSQIKQAAAVTDLSHFFALYGRSILDDGLEAQAWINLSVGIYDGATKVLYKWHEFAKRLGHRETRTQTIRDVAHDCYQVGKMFYHILEQCNEFNPFAYLDDITKDMQDATDRIFTNYNFNEDDLRHHKSRMEQRQERNIQSLQNGLSNVVHAGTAVVQSMLTKTCKENISDITEFSLDAIIYGKITDAVLAISKIGASQCFATSRSFQLLSQEMLEDTMSFATNNNGELVAITNISGENISAALASATQIVTNNIGPVFKYAGQAKILSDKIDEITKPNKHEVEAFQKSIEPYLNSEKIIDVERLKSIDDIDQITEFKKYTNNFKDLEKLKPEEILYLNLCDWLEPKAAKINAQLKASGGLKIIDPISKTEVIIEEFDLFHSLLCEMKPEALANRTSGGHLMIPELHAATLDIRNIESLGNGFLDIEIKYAGKLSDKYKKNSYFPAGTTPERAVKFIEDSITNFKKIKNVTPTGTIDRIIFEFQNYENQSFKVYIKENIARFHPFVD
jgi:hypothetical protein